MIMYWLRYHNWARQHALVSDPPRVVALKSLPDPTKQQKRELRQINMVVCLPLVLATVLAVPPTRWFWPIAIPTLMAVPFGIDQTINRLGALLIPEGGLPWQVEWAYLGMLFYVFWETTR